MSGLIKSKNYDWKDSNVALFGSDTDRQVKKSSAETEPAWRNVGQKVGLKIWRIVNFKVTDWPQVDYGKFYSGDSYIIFNTYKRPSSDELLYDIHFWIGSQSTADEYGTAAYKTVELDTYLDDKPIQHREVEGYESNLFKSYFKNGITTMAGGADSGFRQVKPIEYKPRLLHFCGTRQNIAVNEVALCPSKLDSDDVFILDLGLTIYQWNGKGSDKNERFKAMQYLQNLRSERPKCTTETLEDIDTPKSHPFYEALTGSDEPDHHIHGVKAAEKELIRVSDESGRLTKTQVKKGTIQMKDFESKDVFILDTGDNCFVWIGKGASTAEKQNGFSYAHIHLMKTDHPLIPVHVVKEGQTNKDFQAAVAA